MPVILTMHSLASVLLIFVLAVAVQTTSYGCPPDGPLLPRPTSLTSSSHIQNATDTLQELIHRAIEGDINAGFALENTSFSLALVSFGDEDAGAPTWQYHHRGAANTRGVDTVNGNTQYLIGSISKVFSDLLLLKTGIDLDDPVAKHLPELDSSKSIIDWNSITLASLADHLSGIPPNDGFSEFYFLQSVFEQLGFPPLTEADYGSCGITGLNDACTQKGDPSSDQAIEKHLTVGQISSKRCSRSTRLYKPTIVHYIRSSPLPF